MIRYTRRIKICDCIREHDEDCANRSMPMEAVIRMEFRSNDPSDFTQKVLLVQMRGFGQYGWMELMTDWVSGHKIYATIPDPCYFQEYLESLGFTECEVGRGYIGTMAPNSLTLIGDDGEN